MNSWVSLLGFLSNVSAKLSLGLNDRCKFFMDIEFVKYSGMLSLYGLFGFLVS